MALRKTFCMFMIALVFLCVPLPVSADDKDEKELNEPSVSANSAVLYCVNSGTFLFEKNAEEKMPMASTTKIMTTLLALEKAAANDETVTVTTDMYAEGSSMYLKAGSKLKLSDLAVGMMTVSGNDAANAVALTLSDSFEDFAKLMNNKAKQIGMVNTSFVTPSGLDDENHYSTAKDMAKLMEYSLANERFAEITAQKSIKVNFIEPKDSSNTYSNHNKLLSLYENCTGGKTGYTKTAGRCLVSSAEKDGVVLVAVTLSAPDDWTDHINLYKYGFSSVASLSKDEYRCESKVKVVGSNLSEIAVSSFDEGSLVVPKGELKNVKKEILMPNFVYAPIEKGQVLGKVIYTLNGKEIASSSLTANDNCYYKEREKSFWDNLKEFIGGIFR